MKLSFMAIKYKIDASQMYWPCVLNSTSHFYYLNSLQNSFPSLFPSEVDSSLFINNYPSGLWNIDQNYVSAYQSYEAQPFIHVKPPHNSIENPRLIAQKTI